MPFMRNSETKSRGLGHWVATHTHTEREREREIDPSDGAQRVKLRREGFEVVRTHDEKLWEGREGDFTIWCGGGLPCCPIAWRPP
jgi:hypothetical protein